MSRTQVCIQLCCCVLAAATLAQAQSGRKPGLYEVTSQMSMGGAGAPQMPQMPQLPPGVQLPPGMKMPPSPFGSNTVQVCVTQDMIDKYGGPAPSMHHGQCQVTDISKKDNGMTAKMTCTGQLNATGTVETTWTDANTIQTKVHMTGTMQMGQNSQPLDMTVQSTSVYKGADCGDVKPMAMPPSK